MGTSTENVRVVISAKDKASGVLNKIKGAVIGMVAAYAGMKLANELIVESVKASAQLEATMVSLRAVVAVTGRDYSEVMREMAKHTGGLASKANIAQGFLKGMTTELNPEQISLMTQAIKDASIAMGEDFNTQLPLIIKAVKQLNPAILDNIGVTVRLDRVNKKITDGFYGMGREINEATQQHAIFTEIMKQTAKFAGQEATFLETTAGKVKQLSVAYEDLSVAIGDTLLTLTGSASKDSSGWLRDMTVSITGWLDAMNETAASKVGGFERLWKTYIFGGVMALELAEEIAEEQKSLAEAAEYDRINALGILRLQAEEKKQQELQDLIDKVVITQLTSEKIVLIWEDANDLMEADDEEYTDHITYEAVLRLKRIAAAKKKEVAITEAAIKKEVAAFKQAEREKGLIQAASFERSRVFLSNMGNSIISTFGKTKREADQIWKDMAKAFIEFFVKKALFALTGPAGFGFEMVSALKLFDVPANDRMAIQMGRDYATFFTQGVNQGMADFTGGFSANLGGSPSLNAANGPASGTIINNIYLSAGVDESMVRNVLAPVLSDLAANNFTNIMFDPQTFTSEGTVEFA